MNIVRYQKETFENKTKKAVKSLIITLSLMIVALMAMFLVTTNQSAQKGYALQQQKLKNEHLKSINSGLTTKITDATAFLKLENNKKLDQMENPITKNYVTPEDNSVK